MLSRSGHLYLNNGWKNYSKNSAAQDVIRDIMNFIEKKTAKLTLMAVRREGACPDFIKSKKVCRRQSTCCLRAKC